MCVALRWEQFDKNYLSKLLLRKSVYRKSELWEAYQKINIRDAISVIDQVRASRHFSHTGVSVSSLTFCSSPSVQTSRLMKHSLPEVKQICNEASHEVKV